MQSSFRKEVGTHIAEIKTPKYIDTSEDASFTPKSFQEVTSYNWLESTTPTIMVPGTQFPIVREMTLGAPAKWTPKVMPIRIQSDSGLIYIDQNAFRSPRYPLEPLFRSIYITDPKFDPKEFDLVTDRNNLRKLMFMLSDVMIGDFRIDLELVGNTLLFTRWETTSSEYLTDFRGFGHEFERKFTTYASEMSRSTGHHRVVSYAFGGLKLLLRFEVDAHTGDYGSAKSEDIDNLTAQIGSLRLQSQTASDKTDGNVQVTRGGYHVPHKSLVELKTRAKHRRIQTSDVIYQLWFSQVEHLFVGYHNRGVFTELNQTNYKTSGGFDRFTRDKGMELRRLIKLIREIRKTMITQKRPRAVLLHEGGSLHLYEKGSNQHALPADLLLKWE